MVTRFHVLMNRRGCAERSTVAISLISLHYSNCFTVKLRVKFLNTKFHENRSDVRRAELMRMLVTWADLT